MVGKPKHLSYAIHTKSKPIGIAPRTAYHTTTTLQGWHRTASRKRRRGLPNPSPQSASARGNRQKNATNSRTGHTESAVARLFSVVTFLPASPLHRPLGSSILVLDPHRPPPVHPSQSLRLQAAPLFLLGSAHRAGSGRRGVRVTPMHPKLSRAARRLLCCGRAASPEDL